METLADARDKILREITSDDEDTRREYLARFESDAKSFSGFMAEGFMLWRSMDDSVGKSEELAYVSGLVYMAITLQIQSMKLFLSGHAVAAGNTFRQVLESIALALLCSSKRHNFLQRLIDDRYSSNNAVRDVIRHAAKLGVLKDGLEVLKNAHAFYSKYSHPTKLTIASTIAMSGKGIYVGASFDEEKLYAYKKEVKGRLGLAKTFPNIITAIKLNVAKWEGSDGTYIPQFGMYANSKDAISERSSCDDAPCVQAG